MGKDRNHRSNSVARFAKLEHRLLRSTAYRACSPNARALLVELVMIYNGANNGRLFLSVRDAAARMGVADPRAARAAFDELATLGLIACEREAVFATQAGEGSRARCWRLTFAQTEGKAPSFEYEHAEPATKLMRKRAERGNRALKRHERQKTVGVESSTLDVESVEESTTRNRKQPPSVSSRGSKSTTGNAANPLVSVDPSCGGNAHTYRLPSSEGEKPVFDARKQANLSGGANRAETVDRLRWLRSRAVDLIAASPAGAQSELAKRAQIPGGTFSKFLAGRGLPERHFVALDLELKRLTARAA